MAVVTSPERGRMMAMGLFRCFMKSWVLITDNGGRTGSSCPVLICVSYPVRTQTFMATPIIANPRVSLRSPPKASVLKTYLSRMRRRRREIRVLLLTAGRECLGNA